MPALELLEQVSMFADVERKHLEHLADTARELDVPAGAELTHEGRYEGYVFLVVAGNVGIERDGQRVDTVGAGDFFGEIAAIDGGPRTATARALEDSRLLMLSHEPFYEALEASSGLRSAVMEAMEERLRRIDAEGGE